MEVVSEEPSINRERGRLDRGFLLFILGAVALIVAGLIAVPLAERRAPALAAESTPEGVVQRFYQALYAEDYQTAYGYISAESQRKLTLEEFLRQAADPDRNTQVRITETTVQGETATVEVILTSFNGAACSGVANTVGSRAWCFGVKATPGKLSRGRSTFLRINVGRRTCRHS